MGKGILESCCVEMTGPDTRMDERGDYDEPANPLPHKCPHCTFPDLDFIARPYLLAKGVSSPAETAPAEVGNFLVRERVRRILELVVPDACTFHSTAEWKSKKAAPWWLAVPERVLPMPGLKLHDPERCSKCGEPKLGYRFYDKGAPVGLKHCACQGIDVFKSKEWYARDTAEDALNKCNAYRTESGMEPLPWSEYGIDAPPHPQRWTRQAMDRQLVFSVRLDHLLKKAKVKGQLVRKYDYRDVKPTPEDEAWVQEKLAILARHGLVEAKAADGKAAGKRGSAVRTWFQAYLRKSGRKKPLRMDFAAVEKKHKIKLPGDYKDFISTVGPKSFEDVMETEGFTANILPPGKLDFRDYRRGKLNELVSEMEQQLDGVMFADTDHGDVFLFDVSAKGAEYPVYWYDHEQNTIEAFAGSFAECIKRFVERN